MSSGMIPANINNFRLTEGVKSTRRSARAGGRAHAYRSAKSSRGGLGKSACEGERFCPISAGGGAGNTLAVLSRRRSPQGGERACPRACFPQIFQRQVRIIFVWRKALRVPERARFFVRIRAIAAQVILLRYYQDAMTRRRAEGRAFTLLHKNLGAAWAKVHARASGFARFRRAAAQAILLRYCQGVAR